MFRLVTGRVTVTGFNHALVILLVIQQSRFDRVVPRIFLCWLSCVSHAAITRRFTLPSGMIHASISFLCVVFFQNQLSFSVKFLFILIFSS